MNKVVTMEQAVAMIKPGDFVINSGFLTSATPDALMQAVADSFEATGVPNNLTVMFGAGQGNKRPAGTLGQRRFDQTLDWRPLCFFTKSRGNDR